MLQDLQLPISLPTSWLQAHFATTDTKVTEMRHPGSFPQIMLTHSLPIMLPQSTPLRWLLLILTSLLNKIMNANQVVTSNEASESITTDSSDYCATSFQKHFHQFYLEPGISVLMIRDNQNIPQLVIPYKLCTRYLYQFHDCTNHSGVTCICKHLSSDWSVLPK